MIQNGSIHLYWSTISYFIKACFYLTRRSIDRQGAIGRVKSLVLEKKERTQIAGIMASAVRPSFAA